MRRTNTENLFIVVIFLLVYLIASNIPVDEDMWWHLRSGDEMYHNRTILLVDQFSYTMQGKTWVNPFWVSDLLLYILWKAGGFWGINIAVSLMAVLVMFIIYLQLRGNTYLKGLLVIIGMASLSPAWVARPQLFSFLFLASLDLYIYKYMQEKRLPLWPIPVLFIVWGYFHGGFIWGILLMIAVLVGKIFDLIFDNEPKWNWIEIRRFAMWTALSCVSILLNPNGLLLWKLPFRQLDVALAIQEWTSPDFHQFYTQPPMWLFGMVILGLAYSNKKPSFTDIFKISGYFFLFLFAQRNILAYTVIITPIAFYYLSQTSNFFSKGPVGRWLWNHIPKGNNISSRVTGFINTSIVVIFGISLIINSFILSTAEKIQKSVPYASIQWIKANKPQGPIFNSFNWGGYLTWELRDYPVFIDGRADLYGDKIISDWLEISRGTNRGLKLLDEYKINLIYLEPYHGLLNQLPETRWEEVYSDSQIIIYKRKDIQ